MADRMQRLMQRHQERQAKQAADREARQQAREKGNGESVSEFEEEIERYYSDIRTAIAGKEFQEAQQLLRSANAFLNKWTNSLPSYTVKQTQNAIDSLDKEISQKLAVVQPRKRFSFRSVQPASNEGSQPQKQSDVESHTVDALDEMLKDRLSSNDIMIKNLTDEKYRHTDANSKINSITIIDVKASIISICRTISSLRIVSVQDSLIMVGPVAGSVYVENCRNCTLIFASRQVRIHKTHHVNLYIFAKSNPIIEDCSKIAVAPFNFVYDDIEQSLTAADLTSTNMYDQVQDFKWLKDGAAPNWSIIPESLRIGEFRPDCDTLLIPNTNKG